MRAAKIKASCSLAGFPNRFITKVERFTKMYRPRQAVGGSLPRWTGAWRRRSWTLSSTRLPPERKAAISDKGKGAAPGRLPPRSCGSEPQLRVFCGSPDSYRAGRLPTASAASSSART
jgi:hypothetical protein